MMSALQDHHRDKAQRRSRPWHLRDEHHFGQWGARGSPASAGGRAHCTRPWRPERAAKRAPPAMLTGRYTGFHSFPQITAINKNTSSLLATREVMGPGGRTRGRPDDRQAEGRPRVEPAKGVGSRSRRPEGIRSPSDSGGAAPDELYTRSKELQRAKTTVVDELHETTATLHALDLLSATLRESWASKGKLD